MTDESVLNRRASLNISEHLVPGVEGVVIRRLRQHADFRGGAEKRKCLAGQLLLVPTLETDGCILDGERVIVSERPILRYDIQDSDPAIAGNR